MKFSDEWLVPTVESLIPEDVLTSLRGGEGDEPVSLWETLVSRKLATDDQVVTAIATKFRLPVAEIHQIEARVRDAVPEQLARSHSVIPLKITDSYLVAASANPFDVDAEKILAFATGREVRLHLCPPGIVKEKLDEIYRAEDVVSKLLDDMDDSASVEQLDEEVEELGATIDEASQRPIIRLVDMMLADGIASRASDIHVEPSEGGVIVRYRIDGVLRQVMKIPRTAGLPLISRLKIISGLDIADRLRPQDGRARVSINNDRIDLRVSTLPASLGEKVVIRILNANALDLSLDALGLLEDERDSIAELLDNKEGIVLVTGPTGSGKTTTLYSAIRLIQGEGTNIVTVEDPVEYRMGQNIVQVQVHEKAGLTFASALRSILRQDPDVVLIGEIRDRETSQIAVQASLTGHLVLSTLHTNDAPNTITRLVDMGMEAYKIGSALRGVIAQRLMRRLCQVCRQDMPKDVRRKLPQHVAAVLPKDTKLFVPVGCPDCSMTGYRGRFSIVQILRMSKDIERVVSEGGTADLIETEARKAGMLDLWQSGLRHVLNGDTSVEELLRVTDIPTGSDENGGPSPESPPSRGSETAGMSQAEPEVMTATALRAHPVDFAEAFELLEDDLQGLADVPGVESKGVKVLLVDDEEQLRRVMRDLLEREGYDIAEAADGPEAIDMVDQFAPDIIVLDLNLPTLDGYSVLTQLRTRPTTQNIPVIVLTAKGDEDNEVRVFELGADDFLTKPFRARALAARLDAILARRRS
jgi:type II secretory ATPase GspE/PulE/Tfp pilus assembly ATPase PilB-like protein/CheY-like chemotaxis protein